MKQFFYIGCFNFIVFVICMLWIGCNVETCATTVDLAEIIFISTFALSNLIAAATLFIANYIKKCLK